MAIVLFTRSCPQFEKKIVLLGTFEDILTTSKFSLSHFYFLSPVQPHPSKNQKTHLQLLTGFAKTQSEISPLLSRYLYIFWRFDHFFTQTFSHLFPDKLLMSGFVENRDKERTNQGWHQKLLWFYMFYCRLLHLMSAMCRV